MKPKNLASEKPKNLASERVRLGMSQSDLAETLGVGSYKTIGKYEEDETQMPPKVLSDAATLFGCSVDYLLGRTDERLPRTV